MTVKARYEALARQWDVAGRPVTMLLERGWPFASVYLWLHSDGAKKDDYSELLVDYVNASGHVLWDDYPGWYDKFFFSRERDHCERCGQPWLRENLSFCTDCHALYCIDCIHVNKPGSNGNRVHYCGGEIVG